MAGPETSAKNPQVSGGGPEAGDTTRMEARRPQALEAGLFLVTVAVPLAFTPFTWAPFADPKLVLLSLGALLVWIGGPPLDRRIALPATAWFAATALAAATGVDPLRSLTGLDAMLTGLGMFGASAILVTAGAGLGPELIARVRSWLEWTGVAMAIVLLLWRLVPALLTNAVHDLGFGGSTAGNPLFAVAVMTIGLASAVADDDRSRARRLAIVAVLATGISLSGERVAYALPLIAVPIALWRSRVPTRPALAMSGAIVAVLAAWAAVEPVLPSDSVASPARQLSSVESDAQRLTVFAVDTRAWLERPVLGWGPANTWSAFRATATPAETDRTGPGWDEAHDIVIQTAASTGVVGLLALGWLDVVVGRRVLRAGRELGWAVGSVAALAAFALVEPFNLTVTPLTFLLAGIGASRATAASPPREGFSVARALVSAGLAAGLVLSGLVATASALEQWGRRYEEAWALRKALQLQPWRVSAIEALAEDLALDGRGGKPGAGLEARKIVREGIAEHPWDPQIRLEAADVETLLRDEEAALGRIDEQLERFPGDAGWLPTSEEIAERGPLGGLDVPEGA